MSRLLFTYKSFELLEPYEGKLSRTVLRGESGSNAADLLDKKYYDALKAVNDLVKDARKVQETILMGGEIADIYINSYQLMLQDENFTLEELGAIAFGYSRLLEESSNLLLDLKGIVNSSSLSMTDKERMDIINGVYVSVQHYRNLVRYYTNKNLSVSYLRAQKKGDTERMLALYGNADERYW